MDFKFRTNVFKNDPSQNKNNNPNFPTHSATLEMPLGKLQEYVEYLHWAAKTELKYDDYLQDHVVPIQISGWAKTSERTGKKYLNLEFQPHFKTLGNAIAKKEAAELADTQEIMQHQQNLDKAAANLAQGTAGTVVIQPDSDDEPF